MRGYRVFDVIENRYSDKNFFVDKAGVLYIKDGIQLKNVDTDRYIVEESTGLKDKNDKMIFDGDIDLEYGVVKWSDNYGGWFCFKDGEERPLYDYPLFEVVGTIHDNPELEVTQ